MIKLINESTDLNREEARRLLDLQNYSEEDMVKTVISYITNNSEYKGIDLAYNSEYSTDETILQVEDFAEQFVDEYVIDEIVVRGEDYEYDYTEIVYDMIEEHEDDIETLDKEFDYLVAELYSDSQDEIDAMNSEYYRSI